MPDLRWRSNVQVGQSPTSNRRFGTPSRLIRTRDRPLWSQPAGHFGKSAGFRRSWQAMHANPYGEDLGNRDPLEALGETPIRIRTIVERWGDDHFERSYAPGKWSARQILAHLAQTELALTTRARFALSTPGYVAQPFSQDDWVPLDQGAEARTALDAYIVLRKLNVEMWRRLSPDQLARSFQHPEYGELSVSWIMSQLAGHDIHHLKQIERIK